MPAREPHTIQGDLFDTLARLFTGKPRTRRSTPKKPSTGDNSILRTITLDGTPLTYRLRRSARRTLGFVIDETGLTVTAPTRCTIAIIEDAIQRKRCWIQNKIALYRQQNLTKPIPPHWENGSTLPYLGKDITLVIETAATRRITIHAETDRLCIRIPATATQPPELGTHLKKWLKTQAHTLLAQRLEHYAAQMNVSYDTFRLSGARTRWGSCSAKRHIRLNWRLIHCDITLIDYVAIHELAHLTEMNHSTRFWAIVRQWYPTPEQARQRLREQSARLFNLFGE